MAKAYVNKRDKFLWDNSFKPEDKVPVPSVSDEGKAIVVNDDGDYVLDKVATDTIYFDLRVDTSDYSITVTDTDYTVAEINDLARTYTTTILLRVQYDENNIYRLFRLYRVENWVTKWNDTVSVAEDDLVTINNDLINMQNDGTVRIYRRSIDNTMYNYSTTEHVVGTWIDGKPLYEKTIIYDTAVEANATVNIALADYNITGVDNVISIEGISFGGIPVNCRWPQGGYNWGVACFYNSGNITIVNGGDRIHTGFWITLQYTKTS